jgi:hypothetical protein
MRIGGKQPGWPRAKIRSAVLALLLTLVVFAIIGALVTLLRETGGRTVKEGKVPQARQIDRETLRKGSPVPGS